MAAVEIKGAFVLEDGTEVQFNVVRSLGEVTFNQWGASREALGETVGLSQDICEVAEYHLAGDRG